MIYSAIALILSASALTACSSDDGVTGDPARDWAGTTTAFTPTDRRLATSRCSTCRSSTTI